ncbi:threonine aldolase family protein [Calditrichota bacterium]
MTKLKIIDLRSDTITRPSPEMRKAMYDAEVGDDVFGDDPTVNRLQDITAELLGKEAALFVPSGTMANQIALNISTDPGEIVYCEAGSHVFNFEAAAGPMLSGIMLYPIQGKLGAFTVEDIEQRLSPNDSHYAPSRLIWVENTANKAGGTVFPQEEILRLAKFADQHMLLMHLDGARIWNAAAATGKSEAELAEPFNTVNVCLSKGLGAPVGSLIAGQAQAIHEMAHRARKRFGGGMRQAGVIAAAGIYAIEHNRQRLVDDHERAHRLALALSEMDAFSVDMASCQTNILFFDVVKPGLTAVDVVAKLAEHGVLMINLGRMTLRLVTHLDVNDEDIDKTISTLRELFD